MDIGILGGVIIASMVLGAALNKFRGTGGNFFGLFKTGVGKARIIVALYVALLSYGIVWWYGLAPTFVMSFVALAAFPLIWPAISLGWGSYMDMGTMNRRDNDWLKIPLDLIGLKEKKDEGELDYKGDQAIIPNPLRDFVGMMIIGFCIFVPTALVFAYFINWYALFMITHGVLFAVGYYLASKVTPWDIITTGELFAGALLGLAPWWLILGQI